MSIVKNARASQVMNDIKTDCPETLKSAGVIDLQTIQRYINFWFSSSLDLFGSEISTNAATAFANGLKGRPDEFRFNDHSEKDTTYEITRIVDKKIIKEDIPTRNAMNEITRQAYIKDCEVGLKRWNRLIKKSNWDIVLTLPSTRFRRNIGVWGDVFSDTSGNLISKEEFERKTFSWIPSKEDKLYVNSLMKQETDPDKVANWIAAPQRGINNQSTNFSYVDLH